MCIFVFYHTEHLLTGFMGEPGEQLNTWAKSFELESVPITRNLPGECRAVFSLFFVASGRIEPHHTWAKFRKNNCLPVALIPGKVSSSLSFERSHLSYACKEEDVRTSKLVTIAVKVKSLKTCVWNYSKCLFNAAIIGNIFPLRINTVNLHSNFRDSIMCVLICEIKKRARLWERNNPTDYRWIDDVSIARLSINQRENFIFPYQWDIAPAGENHRSLRLSTTYQDFHLCRTTCLYRQIHE